MASRPDRKRRFAQQRATKKPGIQEFSIALQNLPPPEREFYANTAHLIRRENCATFLFGQLAWNSQSVSNVVLLDLPYIMVRPLAQTYDETFRKRLVEATKHLGEMEKWYSSTKEIQSFSFGVHIAKLMINNHAGVLDFFELLPNVPGPPAIDPVIRIKVMPVVVRWFVDNCDRIVTEMPEQPEEADVIIEKPQ